MLKGLTDFREVKLQHILDHKKGLLCNVLWNPLLTWASTFLILALWLSRDWDSWECFTWPWSSSGAWEIIAVQDHIFMRLQRKLQNNTLKKVTFWDCRLKPYWCHLQNIRPSPSDDICMRLQRELYSKTDDNHFVTSREKLTQHVHIDKFTAHMAPTLSFTFLKTNFMSFVTQIPHKVCYLQWRMDHKVNETTIVQPRCCPGRSMNQNSKLGL